MSLDEDVDDRRWRHYIEGRVMSAVAAATQEIQQDIGLVKSALFGGGTADPNDRGLVGDVRTIKGWLVGNTSATGEQSGGIAAKVTGLWAARLWVLGLLATAATAAVGILVLQALQAAHIISTGKP